MYIQASDHRQSSYTVQKLPLHFRDITSLLALQHALLVSLLLPRHQVQARPAAAAAASAKCRLGKPQHTILETRSSLHQALVSLLGCSNNTATDATVWVDDQINLCWQATQGMSGTGTRQAHVR